MLGIGFEKGAVEPPSFVAITGQEEIEPQHQYQQQQFLPVTPMAGSPQHPFARSQQDLQGCERMNPAMPRAPIASYL